MSPQLIYTKLLLKVNKGNSGGNIVLDKPRFVLLFNECKNRWVETHLKDKDSILIDSLWETVESDQVSTPKKFKNYTEFYIPTDFYEFIGGTCEAEKGVCKRTLYMREVKNQNKTILQFDSNQAPDFDYEWTFCSLQNKNIRVYTSDFDVLKINIEYYRVIPDIDIEGYINIEGKPSVDIPCEISDQYVDQIINLTAEEFMRDFQDPNNLSLAKDRTKSQE
jgi:hypothetical protein